MKIHKVNHILLSASSKFFGLDTSYNLATTFRSSSVKPWKVHVPSMPLVLINLLTKLLYGIGGFAVTLSNNKFMTELIAPPMTPPMIAPTTGIGIAIWPMTVPPTVMPIDIPTLEISLRTSSSFWSSVMYFEPTIFFNPYAVITVSKVPPTNGNWSSMNLIVWSAIAEDSNFVKTSFRPFCFLRNKRYFVLWILDLWSICPKFPDLANLVHVLFWIFWFCCKRGTFPFR